MIGRKAIAKLRRFAGANRLEEISGVYEIDTAFVDGYLGEPLLRSLAKGNSSNSRCVVFSERVVLGVYGVIGWSKVRPPVVRSVLVNVVNMLPWQRSSHIKEGKTVSTVSSVENAYPDIPLVEGASDIANMASLSHCLYPGKQPSIRAIVKNRFDILLCKFHEASSGVVESGARVLQHLCSANIAQIKNLAYQSVAFG